MRTLIDILIWLIAVVLTTLCCIRFLSWGAEPDVLVVFSLFVFGATAMFHTLIVFYRQLSDDNDNDNE